MKKKIAIFTILFFVFCFFLFLFWNFNQMKKYTMNLFYFDTYIKVDFYTNKPKREIERIKNEMENVYKIYHELANRYEEYGKNVYYLIHNQSEEEIISIDARLYELLEYSNEWVSKSNGKLNINMGCVIDKWKMVRESQTAIPTKQELAECDNSNTLVLLGDNKVFNNHANIDLGAIAKGYATEKVGLYLKKEGIEHFLINAGGNVLVGASYKKDTYHVGIQNPNDNSVFKVLKVQNKAVVTSGGYERFYLYEGKRYHHLIDPETKYPGEYMKSVTVIAEDSALADALSTTLFLMPIESGKEFLKDYKDVEAIWYTNEDEVICTEGVSLYE